MSESIPIVMIAIAVILVVLALLAVLIRRKQQKGELERPVFRHKKAFFVQWIIGLVLALAGAFFMFDGDILGESTTGIATVVGIMGLVLIASSNFTLLDFGRKK